LGIVKRIWSEEEPLRRAILYIDDPFIKDGVVAFLTDYGNIPVEVDIDQSTNKQIPENAIVFTYQDVYKPGSIEQIQKNMPNSSVCLCSYRIEQHLYIDNIYIPDISNPDHHDNISVLRDKALNTQQGIGSFFTLFDQFVKDKIPTEKMTIKLRPVDRCYILYLLSRSVEKVLGTHPDILLSTHVNRGYSVDLRNGLQTEYVSRVRRR